MAVATTRRKARELREAVSGIATYWDNGAEALRHVTEILRDRGLDVGACLEHVDAGHGSHRWLYEVVSDETGEVFEDTNLVWMLYKMESGRVEVTCYLS